jgi:uncharacterized protein YjiS (DUF1127 family)
MSCGSAASTALPTIVTANFAPKAFALKACASRAWARMRASARRLSQLYARRRQRLALLELNDWLLRHIGLSRTQLSRARAHEEA